ncbi:pseudouridine synthase [Firmicutes bacterium CAG:884]|nr:pseudouridine synthase [Firmicutes bacterium CAG:884]
MERLQKVIAEAGYASRRKAEELIKAGKVYVNGEKVTEMGFKVNGNDIIDINGKPLKKEEKEYYLLNKPRGVVTTTSDDKDRKVVTDLIETTKRIYPIGRLDYDTTGALILTNDGELTNLLNHPSSEIQKVYVAKIEGIVEPYKVKKLSDGVIVDGKKTSKAKVRIKKLDKKNDASYIELTIHEGRNHQVKKMFEAIGYNVIKLKREKYAFLDVNSLKSGEYRKLNTKEVKSLYALCKSKTK